MTKIFTLILSFFAIFFTFTPYAKAQEPAYKAVFQLTSDNPKTWNGLLNNLENAMNDLDGNVTFEVVAHSKGLNLLLKEFNQDTLRIDALSARGVTFFACENTMQRKGYTKDDLISAAKTIPSGVGHVIKRQSEGWAYVRMTD